MNTIELKINEAYKTHQAQARDWREEAEKILTLLVHFPDHVAWLDSLKKLEKDLPGLYAKLRAAGGNTPPGRKVRAQIKRLMEKGESALRNLVSYNEYYGAGNQETIQDMTKFVNDCYAKFTSRWRPEVEGHIAGKRLYHAALEIIKIPRLPASALIYGENSFVGEPGLTKKVQRIINWKRKIFKKLPRKDYLEARRDYAQKKIETVIRELRADAHALHDYYDKVHAGHIRPDYTDGSWKTVPYALNNSMEKTNNRYRRLVEMLQKDNAALLELSRSQGRAAADSARALAIST